MASRSVSKACSLHCGRSPSATLPSCVSVRAPVGTGSCSIGPSIHSCWRRRNSNLSTRHRTSSGAGGPVIKRPTAVDRRPRPYRGRAGPFPDETFASSKRSPSCAPTPASVQGRAGDSFVPAAQWISMSLSLDAPAASRCSPRAWTSRRTRLDRGRGPRQCIRDCDRAGLRLCVDQRSAASVRRCIPRYGRLRSTPT